MRKTLAVLFAPFAAVPVLACAQHAHWTYQGEEGPAHWAKVEKDFATCGIGKEQSPIDIKTKAVKKEDLPALQFNYKPIELSVVNNGHSVQVTYTNGSTLTVGGDTYELQQFHFHAPSEEKIDGKSHDMVAHFVHKNAAGQLAVVAVLFDKGAENAALKPIFAKLPKKDETRDDKSVMVDAAAIIPANHAYYTFDGSLTTPPCSEGVRWFVLKTPATLSASESQAFHKLYSHNARPVQPLNGRVVKASAD
jgi:carbonic anhydrase